MDDRLDDGHPFRTLNIMDEGNREVLAIELSTSLPSRRVTAVLEQLVALHGRPTALRLDNGPEFLAQTLATWCATQARSRWDTFNPASRTRMRTSSASITYRHEVLDAWLFASLDEARDITSDLIMTYNTKRPHDSLGGVPPLDFLPRPTSSPVSGYQLST